jgi:hypothetical protein
MHQAFRRLTATDDQGASYQLRLGAGSGTGALELQPDPPPAIRWLDVIAAPGAPGIRVDLGRRVPAAQAGVSRGASGPGELMLDVVASRILTSTADFGPGDPGYLASGALVEHRGFVGDRPGEHVGVHHGEPGTIVHMLVSGVTGEDDWWFMRGVRPLPALWVRDSAGRWHATRISSHGAGDDSGEVLLWLEIVPPLERGTAWIDLVVTGASAEIEVRLPLRGR